MGHEVGDELLKQFATRVKKELLPTDFICRLGGDEFAIILSPIYTKEDIIDPVERIITQLRIPWSIHNQSFVTTSSIGISIYPHDGENKHELLSNADHALYQAKEDGRNLYRFFTKKLEKKVNRMMLLESDLKEALGKNQFHLVYQPRRFLLII